MAVCEDVLMYRLLPQECRVSEKHSIHLSGQRSCKVHKMALLPPLRRMEAAGTVCVNFDPDLVKLLREVHDFLLLPDLPADIPEAAIKASGLLPPL